MLSLRMRILNSVAPGGKDGCENVAISFSALASGLIKMEANWPIKEKHIFMVMDLESSLSVLTFSIPSLTHPDYSIVNEYIM